MNYKDKTMLAARCRVCGKEILASKKAQGCGCLNQMIVKEDTVTATNLDDVILIDSKDSLKSVDFLTSDDLNYQEKRRKRKIRKLTFEER